MVGHVWFLGNLIENINNIYIKRKKIIEEKQVKKLKIKNKFKFNNLFLYITLDSLFLRRFFECFKPFFFFIFQNFVLPENFIECKTLFINDLCAKFSIYAQNLVLLDKMFLETSNF